MYDVYFDSGTTNTRMYVIDEAGSVVFKTEKAVGSKDAALANDRLLLARELYALYVSMLAEKGLRDADIQDVWQAYKNSRRASVRTMKTDFSSARFYLFPA